MVAVAVVAMVGIGIGVGLLASHGTVAPPPPVAHASDGPAANPPPSSPDNTQTIVAQNPPPQSNPIVVPQPQVQTSAVALAPTNVPANPTNWEDTIDTIIGSEDADTNKVKQLFALFPKLPADGQEEVVQHLSNLVEDSDYAPLGELLKNDNLSDGVLDELLADLLNRPNSLKLPLLLDLAQDPNNAKHYEAKDLLELYLGEDYGTNWSTWQTSMNTWMQQNPD